MTDNTTREALEFIGLTECLGRKLRLRAFTALATDNQKEQAKIIQKVSDSKRFHKECVSLGNVPSVLLFPTRPVLAGSASYLDRFKINASDWLFGDHVDGRVFDLRPIVGGFFQKDSDALYDAATDYDSYAALDASDMLVGFMIDELGCSAMYNPTTGQLIYAPHGKKRYHADYKLVSGKKARKMVAVSNDELPGLRKKLVKLLCKTDKAELRDRLKVEMDFVDRANINDEELGADFDYLKEKGVDNVKNKKTLKSALLQFMNYRNPANTIPTMDDNTVRDSLSALCSIYVRRFGVISEYDIDQEFRDAARAAADTEIPFDLPRVRATYEKLLGVFNNLTELPRFQDACIAKVVDNV